MSLRPNLFVPLLAGGLLLLPSTPAHGRTLAQFSNAAPIAIADSASPPTRASLYPSNIVVSGLSGTVLSVRMTLNGLSHTAPDDLDVLLVGPGGQNAVVMSDACGTGDLTSVSLTFDDLATVPLAAAGPCGSGTFQPANYPPADTWPTLPTPSGSSSLSTFIGTNPNGVWSLYVVDDSNGDTGTIASGWTLTITSGYSRFGLGITIGDDPPKPTPAAPYPRTIDVSGVPGSIASLTVGLSGYSHTYPDDVDVLLVGPGGQNAVIMSDVCGDADVSNLELTFDDSAPQGMPDQPASPCVSGRYLPTNAAPADTWPAPAPIPSGGTALSAFAGTNPNGTWRLYVVDDTSQDAGQIGFWFLDFAVSGPTAVSVTTLSASPQRGGVLVQWRTGSETKTAGFDLYRGTTKLNRSLILARHAGEARGAAYRFLDRTAPSPRATYRLELVQLDGTRAPAGRTAFRTSR